jgi:glycosyltransferase involved in cell wall biosynthesis
VSQITERSLLFVGNFLDIEIGTRAISEDLSLRLEECGWPVLRTSRRRGKVSRLLDMLWTTWRKRAWFDIAIVDVYSGPAFRFAEVVCGLLRGMKKPYVLILHGGNLPAFSAANAKRMRKLLAGAARVTTPSQYLQERMQPYHADLRQLPNPIAVSDYPYRLRSQLEPRLVWLRAFHETYNPLMAVSAVELLRSEFPGISLMMIGPDKGLFAVVHEEILKRGLERNIRMSGAIQKDAVASWLKEADIFLNTTNVDNTPVSVLEAMACGLCVISTNVGGIPYLLKNEEDGLLIEPRDPMALAHAIRKVLKNPALASKLSRNARARVESFDWAWVLPKWQQLLNGVAERRDSSASRPAEVAGCRGGMK